MDKPLVASAEARVAVLELTALLQDAHFAARDAEDVSPPDPKDRLVDRIHAARVIAQHLCALLTPAHR